MTQKKNGSREAPVVQMMIGLRQPAPPRQDHNNPVTVADFEREHLGIAPKE